MKISTKKITAVALAGMMSFGIASSEELPLETWTWEQLFDLADQRLYEGKDRHKKVK